MKAEEKVKEGISTYLRLQYPDVIFRFDIAADLPLPVGLAKKSKHLHKHERGYPDLFIAEPRGGYFGLFIELKAEGVRLRRKDGQYRKDGHIQEQADVIRRLKGKGYLALFVIGFDAAKQVIDEYMRLPVTDRKGINTF